jgi:hypothetical protein
MGEPEHVVRNGKALQDYRLSGFTHLGSVSGSFPRSSGTVIGFIKRGSPAELFVVHALHAASDTSNATLPRGAFLAPESNRLEGTGSQRPIGARSVHLASKTGHLPGEFSSSAA